MNKIVACGLLLVGLFSLTGCFEKEIKTVEYFKTHPEEMEKKIDECKKAKSMTDTDRKECENAVIAKEMKKMGTGLGDDFFNDQPAEQNKTK